MGVILSKSDILDAKDQKTKIVSVPEWGGDVIIAVMSGFARDKFESSFVGAGNGHNMQNVRARLVASSIVDEDGNLVFTDKDIISLGKKSSIALDRIFSVAQSFNKITDDDVDDLAKN